MSESQRFDRKNFLKLTLSIAGASAAGGWLVGCSDGEDPEGGAGSGGTNSAGTGAGGKAGSAGAGGGSSGSGTSGSAGSTAGSSTAGGNAGAAGKGGAGGGAGTVTGGAGSGPGGAAGTTGAGGTTGGSAGTTGGTGGSAFGGAGSGGKGSGGSSGGSGGGAGGGGGKCTAFSMAQEEECDPQCNPHDHIPDQMAARTQLFADLLAHITGPDALEPFLLPTEGPNGGHRHDIQFTQDELDTLLAGGTIMNKQKVPDDVDDHHEWTITVTCA